MTKALSLSLLATTTLLACSSGEGETPSAHHRVAVGDNETLITDNGNFLFYNAPVSASHEGKQYFAWVTNAGKVILQTEQPDGDTTDTVIHSFSEDINPDRGSADDHAAPAILLDEQRDELIIAASYHGTPMYIYAHDISSEEGSTRRLLKISGRYTYPRLFNHQGTIHLLARLQPEGIRAGHLIMRSAEDGFESEQIVIPSEDGEVVYAGTPTVTDRGFAIAHSMLSYEERRLIGFDLLEYDLHKQAPSSQCNLSEHVEPEAYSNRPTGIGFDGDTLLIATTYTEQEHAERRDKYDNFQRRNTVVILEGELGHCDSFETIEKNEVGLPYYHTSVAVNDALEWVYFDGSQHHTNAEMPRCFASEKMMYPNFTDSGIVYAAMNQQYSIRDFDNSVIYCARNGGS